MQIDKKTANIVHVTFDIGLLFKSIFDVFEVLCGVLILFLTPERINRLVAFAVHGELAEEPNSLIAGYITHYSSSLTTAALHFMAFYLLSHGLAKLLMIVLLWKQQLWAYPLSVVMFGFFIYYQVDKFISSHSVVLIFLTAVDVVMIFLTILEYQRLRKERKLLKVTNNDSTETIEIETKDDDL